MTRFIAILKSFSGQPLPLLGYILRGLNKEVKKGNGNLVNDLVGALKGATNGLIDGVHMIQAHDTGKLLSSK